jgi:hypothetical protein
VGTVHPVPGLPTRTPENQLHGERGLSCSPPVRRTKNRGHFPSDDAAIKLLWLAIRDIEDKRARARAKEKGLPAGQRRALPRLVEGAAVIGWRQALGALALHYPDRISPYIN